MEPGFTQSPVMIVYQFLSVQDDGIDGQEASKSIIKTLNFKATNE